MAAPSARRPTRLTWISVFLLLIWVQMLTSLVLSAGVFVLSDEALISPFRFCLIRGEPSCDGWRRDPASGAESEIKINILATVVILALYVPMVLVAFALLATLLAAYARDGATLRFGMACQAASSLLILTGIIGFLLLNRSHASWENMTLWFYICVGAQVELAIATALTRASGRRNGWV